LFRIEGIKGEYGVTKERLVWAGRKVFGLSTINPIDPLDSEQVARDPAKDEP
jgi:hypothetical protein